VVFKNFLYMYNHAPKNYLCPFCLIVQGKKDSVETNQSDIIYQDRFITAWISSRWWPNNPGNVIIVPNKHYENIYDLPVNLAAKIQSLAKKVAIALKKVYPCDGVSQRQHNEPAGNQDIWHYHLQVFPRYKNDRLYENHPFKKLAPERERIEFAGKLREYFRNL